MAEIGVEEANPIPARKRTELWAAVNSITSGRLDGDVTCRTLTVGRSGALAGSAIAETAEIDGTLEGKVTADTVMLGATAQVTGEIVQRNLVIKPGAQFEPSARAAAAERYVVAAFGGDCTLPLAAWARTKADGTLHLTSVLATTDGQQVVRATATGTDPREVAGACEEAMRRDGADDVLRALRS